MEWTATLPVFAEDARCFPTEHPASGVFVPAEVSAPASKSAASVAKFLKVPPLGELTDGGPDAFNVILLGGDDASTNTAIAKMVYAGYT